MFLKKVLNPFRRISIRLRLSLLFVLIFGSMTVLFNAFLFFSMIKTLQQDFDDALFNYAVDVSESIDIGVKGDLNFPPLKLDNGKVLPFPLGTALIQVRHISGTVLAQVGDFGGFNPSYKKDFEQLAKGEEATYRTTNNISAIPSAEADSYRLISFPLDSSTKPQLILQIAVPMTLLETQISNRLKMMQFGIPLVLLIATLGGVFISSRALAPVKSMVDFAKRMDANELDRRIPIPLAKDEVRKLAETLNEMLDRIQQAFKSQERFVADASHQLLTPLTVMRSELETLQKQGTKDIDAFVKSSIQEVDNLSNVVREMLLLSRVDAGLGALNLQSLYLDEIVFASLSRIEKLAKAKNINLKFDIENRTHPETQPSIRGDQDLLEHLLVNIIENAIKYSPIDHNVHIKLTWKNESSEVLVSDQGPGIPAEQLPLIFERFSRVSQTSSQVKGHGLGLAIAQKIAILHGARLSAENNTAGGAAFRLEIKNI